MRMRLFIMFMIIFLLPLLILTVGGEVWMSESIVHNAESSFNSIMENVAERLDNDLESLNSVASLVSADSTIRKIAYMTGNKIDYSRVSMSMLQEYNNELAFHCENSRLYSEVNVCFPQKDFVLSTLGIWKLEWFFNYEFKIKSMDTDSALELLNNGGMLYNCNVSRFDANKRGLVCVVPTLKTASGKVLVSTIFFINNSVLESYLKDLTLFPEAVAILKDAEGRQIAAYCADGNHSLDHFSSFDGDEATYVGGEDTYRVMQYTSPRQKWQYTVFLPEEALYSEVNSFRLMFHILLVVMLLIGLVLSLELSRINYRPFEQFFRLLNLHQITSLRSSAYQMQEAEAALVAIINDKNTLNERLRSNSPMVRYAALVHLLEGSSESARLTETDMLHLLGLSMDEGYYAVAILLGGSSREPVEELSMGSASCYLLDYHSLLTAVISFSAAEDLDLLLGELSVRSERICMSSLNFDSIEGIALAYKQADAARKQLPLRITEKVFYYSDKSSARRTLRYQNDVEKRVLAAIYAGDGNRAYAEIEKLLEANDPSQLSLTAIRKLAFAVETSVSKSDEKGVLAEQINNLPVPEEQPECLLEHLRDVLRVAAEFHLANRDRQQSERTGQIVAFIEEHLCDEQLSLSMVAEAFGVTTTYLSRHIKEQLETNYLDFVNRKRIELAKKLLAQNAGSVREIAQQVGFSSDATFRRQYKKYEGVSPSNDIPDAGTENSYFDGR